MNGIESNNIPEREPVAPLVRLQQISNEIDELYDWYIEFDQHFESKALDEIRELNMEKKKILFDIISNSA